MDPRGLKSDENEWFGLFSLDSPEGVAASRADARNRHAIFHQEITEQLCWRSQQHKYCSHGNDFKREHFLLPQHQVLLQMEPGQEPAGGKAGRKAGLSSSPLLRDWALQRLGEQAWAGLSF